METTANNMSSSPGPMGKSMAKNINEASVEAHQTIDRVSEAARPAVDSVTTGAHQVVDKVAGAAANATETVIAKSEEWKQAQARITENLRDHVSANPLASVGMAVAAGFLLSRLINTR